MILKHTGQTSEYHVTGSEVDSLKVEFDLLEKELEEKRINRKDMIKRETQQLKSP